MQAQQVNSSPQAGGSPSQNSGGANAKLKTECQQFEAVLWNQVLEAMQETVPEDGVTGDSFSSDVYQGMLNEQYAGLVAGQDSSSGGLSGILYQQLSSLGLGSNEGLLPPTEA
jgi:Rod binding domain-containing protein